MKINTVRALGIVAVITVVTTAGCGKKTQSDPSAPAPAGVMERAGARVDSATEKTTEVAQDAATATKDAAGVVVKKTGEVMEKTGSSVEATGKDMQK